MTRLWRAVVPTAITSALIIATGSAIATGAIPALAASPASYAISIGAVNPAYPGAVHGKVDGYALVVYKVRFGHLDSAIVGGSVTGAVAGDRVTLLAKPFGARTFRTGPSAALTPAGGVAPYAFRVYPSLATKYEVRVSTGTRTDSISAVQTVYVTRLAVEAGSTRCAHGRCMLRGKIFAVVPPRAFLAEAAKAWTVYFGLGKGRTTPPAFLRLDSRAVTGKVHRLSRSSFTVPVRIPFVTKLAHPARLAFWVACTKDTEAKDGLGLPGRHGCGAAKLSSSAVYAG